ncbi:MAG: hypothetical protein RLY86_200 [Pseudomonadota bacterium]|jgi:cyclohexadienyl dehydratase
MNRRRLLSTALAAALPGFLSVTALAGAMVTGRPALAREPMLDRIRARGTIRVGTTGDYFPYSFRDVRSGSFIGHDVDLAKRLAADLGVGVEFVQATWPTIVAGLRAGKYDIAASGITITPERARAVAFSRSYLSPAFVAIVPATAAAGYASWRDLDRPGITISLQQGTAPETAAKRAFTQARLVSVMEPVIDFTEVLAGRADATITDNLYFATKIRSEYPQLAMVGGEPLAEAETGLMTRQGEEALVAWIDAWIGERKADGFLDQLYRTWFEAGGAGAGGAR